MKIWVEKCVLGYYLADCDVKFGIGWYRHHKDHKWKGLTISFYCCYWLLNIHFVSNYKEYVNRMNYRRDPDRLKKIGDKLKAIREKK